MSGCCGAGTPPRAASAQPRRPHPLGYGAAGRRRPEAQPASGKCWPKCYAKWAPKPLAAASDTAARRAARGAHPWAATGRLAAVSAARLRVAKAAILGRAKAFHPPFHPNRGALALKLTAKRCAAPSSRGRNRTHSKQHSSGVATPRTAVFVARCPSRLHCSSTGMHRHARARTGTHRHAQHAH